MKGGNTDAVDESSEERFRDEVSPERLGDKSKAKRRQHVFKVSLKIEVTLADA